MLVGDATASATRPFIGLRPFDYPDRARRGEAVDAVESLVARSGFVTVIGSSGSGKSSLIRAGLLPRLETRADELWRLARPMAPGDAPLSNVARAISSLRPKDELSEAWHENIETRLKRSKFGVPEALSLLPELAQGSHVVIVVGSTTVSSRGIGRNAPRRGNGGLADTWDEAARSFGACGLRHIPSASWTSLKAGDDRSENPSATWPCSFCQSLHEAEISDLVPGVTATKGRGSRGSSLKSCSRFMRI